MDVATVIDNGSSDIRAGFAGEEAPASVFPNIVGKSRELSMVDIVCGNI